ncbi:MAG: VanZ family protein [Pyrinomonadaceae bacterium]
MPQKDQASSWRVWLFAYAPLFLWIGVIFFLSSGSGSSAETSRIIGPLIAYFFPNADEGTVALVHAAVRKAAHVTEYAILAALASRAFLRSSIPLLQKYWVLFVIVLVAAIALLDEFNQSFNVLRTGTPIDSLLDICGGLLAISLIRPFVNRRKATT